MVEALAIREAVRFAFNYAIKNSIIESNSKEIVEAVNNNIDSTRWEYDDSIRWE